MKAIIPLAGPDFEREDGTVKGAWPLDGQPLLRRALEARPWWREGVLTDADLVFVLLNRPASRRFAKDCLSAWYPCAKTVWLSEVSRGAALTCLAGLALADLPLHDVLCLDLVDILFDCALDDPAASFAADPDLGGVALAFTSDKSCYSYLRRDKSGRIIEAAEKRVISNEASAGVYLFRSGAVYLRALAHNLDAGEAVTHKGLHFVCPVFNGVLAQGLKVESLAVTNLHDFKFAGV